MTPRGDMSGRVADDHLQQEAIAALVIAILSVTALPPLGFWSVRIGKRVRAGTERRGVVDHGIGKLAVVLGWVGIALTGLIAVGAIIAVLAWTVFSS